MIKDKIPDLVVEARGIASLIGAVGDAVENSKYGTKSYVEAISMLEMLMHEHAMQLEIIETLMMEENNAVN